MFWIYSECPNLFQNKLYCSIVEFSENFALREILVVLFGYISIKLMGYFTEMDRTKQSGILTKFSCCIGDGGDSHRNILENVYLTK